VAEVEVVEVEVAEAEAEEASTQLPPILRDEPTCGTTCHPIPKKHDIPVIYLRTPCK